MKIKTTFFLSVLMIVTCLNSAFAISHCSRLLYQISDSENWYTLNTTKDLEYDTRHFYNKFSSVLRLADGMKGESHSRMMASQLHETEFVSADIFYPKVPYVEGNYSRVKVDNTELFPFEDNRFDLVMMNRGMCTCDDTLKTCGGLDLSDKEQVKTFFSEIIRVLDTSIPDAKAFLTGFGAKDYDYTFEVYRKLRKSLDLGFENVNIKFITFKSKSRSSDKLKMYGFAVFPK